MLDEQGIHDLDIGHRVRVSGPALGIVREPYLLAGTHNHIRGSDVIGC
jgi:hypothetical protein